MEIVCYAFVNREGETESPFLKYLEKYAFQDKDSEKTRLKKIKQLKNIESHFRYLVDHKGKYSIPPLVQQYQGREVGILKIKEADNLVRIAFFTIVGSKIVLLDALDKPKLYEKAKKQQIDKMIQQFLERTESYRKDYLKRNSSVPFTWRYT